MPEEYPSGEPIDITDDGFEVLRPAPLHILIQRDLLGDPAAGGEGGSDAGSGAWGSGAASDSDDSDGGSDAAPAGDLDEPDPEERLAAAEQLQRDLREVGVRTQWQGEMAYESGLRIHRVRLWTSGVQGDLRLGAFTAQALHLLPLHFLVVSCVLFVVQYATSWQEAPPGGRGLILRPRR
eukprot:gene16435-8165_t